MKSLRVVHGLALALVLLPCVAQAQFLPGFHRNGFTGRVWAMASFDDGSGEALYAGGRFSRLDGLDASMIARWDGANWSTAVGVPEARPEVGGSGEVRVLAAADGELYAGGDFEQIGGVAANNIAAWDGTSWRALGAGLDQVVSALAVYDDGGGSKLYAGGGGGLLCWDGTTWSTIIGDSGLFGSVSSLTAFGDGMDRRLYIGGSFNWIDGETVMNIAAWDGSSISSLVVNGENGLSGFVADMAVVDLGDGPRLFISGDFNSAGGQPVQKLVAWDGGAWLYDASNVPGGLLWALTAFDDGGGARLIGGGPPLAGDGVPSSAVVAWDGQDWSVLSSADGVMLDPPRGSLDQPVWSLAVFDPGTGPQLVAGGDFLSDGVRPTSRVARWTGSAWHGLSSGAGKGVSSGGPSQRVSALETFDLDGSEKLYAAGAFMAAGSILVDSIAVYDGSDWTALFDPAVPFDAAFFGALEVFDDGSGAGQRLIAAGDVRREAAPAIEAVATWTGSAWQPLPGLPAFSSGHEVWALEVVDFGGGAQLALAGEFASWAGEATGNIVLWNGAAIERLAGPGGVGTNDDIRALAFFDDGAGPALFVGGEFTEVGGESIQYLAKWDGASWSAPGLAQPDAPVHALAAFDDGGGPALFVGGDFRHIGNEAMTFVAKWDGQAYSALEGPGGTGLAGVEGVRAIRSVDAGDGEKLMSAAASAHRHRTWRPGTGFVGTRSAPTTTPVRRTMSSLSRSLTTAVARASSPAANSTRWVVSRRPASRSIE